MITLTTHQRELLQAVLDGKELAAAIDKMQEDVVKLATYVDER